MLKRLRQRPIEFDAMQFDGTSESATAITAALRIPGAKYRPLLATRAGLLVSGEVDPPLGAMPGEYVIRYSDAHFAQMSALKLAALAEPA